MKSKSADRIVVDTIRSYYAHLLRLRFYFVKNIFIPEMLGSLVEKSVLPLRRCASYSRILAITQSLNNR